jgi:hypothetical protein
VEQNERVEAFRDEAQGQWLRPDEHRPMQSSDFHVNKFIIRLETQEQNGRQSKKEIQYLTHLALT